VRVMQEKVVIESSEVRAETLGTALGYERVEITAHCPWNGLVHEGGVSQNKCGEVVKKVVSSLSVGGRRSVRLFELEIC